MKKKMGNGKYLVLDEDELKEALEQKDITEKDYKMAYDTMNQLMKKYENNVDKLYNISNKYFKMF